MSSNVPASEQTWEQYLESKQKEVHADCRVEIEALKFDCNMLLERAENAERRFRELKNG